MDLAKNGCIFVFQLQYVLFANIMLVTDFLLTPRQIRRHQGLRSPNPLPPRPIPFTTTLSFVQASTKCMDNVYVIFYSKNGQFV